MPNITENELAALKGICKSDFQDGNNPIDHWVWNWSANPFETKRTFSGVIASLVKKGLVKSDNQPGDDGCICITQAGFDVMKREQGK